MTQIYLPRSPRDEDELDAVLQSFWGIKLPRVQVCPDHVSPFHAVAHAYFAREPNYAVWYASRGSGKSLALAALGLTKCFVDDVDVTILGGSIWQSQNVRDHMSKLLTSPNAPRYAIKRDIVTQIETMTSHAIKPLPASQTSVRGPHPPLTLLDEVDEMEWSIYEAAMGQAMEQLNSRGDLVQEYIVASSTWQRPEGTFTMVMDQARKKGLPIFSWCWRELLQEHGGWMSQRFIDKKRAAVSEAMWKTEYELNEPSGASRAFDLDKVEEYFITYPDAIDYQEHTEDDQEWTWEDPVTGGTYATGADWAKEKDKTVIATIRYDVSPRRLVHLRRVNRQPYPVMIKGFDTIVDRYDSTAMHDRTGLGNVVHDFSTTTAGEDATGFMFTDRRKRTQMLLAYITDFEAGAYRLPRNVHDFWRAHRGATTADVYGSHKWDAHLPDDVAAMALAHKAAGRYIVAGPNAVERDDAPSKVEMPFHHKPYEAAENVGEVTIVDERDGYDLVVHRSDLDFLELGV